MKSIYMPVLYTIIFAFFTLDASVQISKKTESCKSNTEKVIYVVPTSDGTCTTVTRDLPIRSHAKKMQHNQDYLWSRPVSYPADRQYPLLQPMQYISSINDFRPIAPAYMVIYDVYPQFLATQYNNRSPQINTENEEINHIEEMNNTKRLQNSIFCWSYITEYPGIKNIWKNI